jgi:site-specific recombinase XerD
MRRWDNLVDQYIEEYFARGINSATIDNVRSELERLGAWLKRQRPKPKLESITSDQLIEYIKSRSVFKAKSTIYGTVSRMRGMGDFLVRQEVWASNPLRWIKGPKVTPYHRMPKRINGTDMQLIWSAAAKSATPFQSQQWITVLALLYGTGIRRGELSRLSLSDWSSSNDIITIDGRKTGLQRNVPVPELVSQCINSYLPYRHNFLEMRQRVNVETLFVNQEGQPITADAISNGVHRIAKRAGVKLHSLHQFRHTCASDLLESGVCMAQVQLLLGHQHLGTTMRYTHIADPKRHEAVARHPLNDWLSQEAC